MVTESVPKYTSSLSIICESSFGKKVQSKEKDKLKLIDSSLLNSYCTIGLVHIKHRLRIRSEVESGHLQNIQEKASTDKVYTPRQTFCVIQVEAITWGKTHIQVPAPCQMLHSQMDFLCWLQLLLLEIASKSPRCEETWAGL